MTDQRALAQVVRDFARVMADGPDPAVALENLAEGVVEVLGAGAAGVALLVDGQLQFSSATSIRALAAERIQERLQEGPCVEALARREPVAADMRVDGGRWPVYCAELDDIGMRSCLGIPLALGVHEVGSLTIYSHSARSWAPDAIHEAIGLAELGTAYAITAGRAAEQR